MDLARDAKKRDYDCERGWILCRCGQCGHEFLIAFSCEGRGVCPACNARRMVETAAHLADHVFPPPAGASVGAVGAQAAALLPAARRRHPGRRLAHFPSGGGTAPARAQSWSRCIGSHWGGGFIHRFGSSLNAHVHFHCVVVESVFEPDPAGGIVFREASGLDEKALTEVQEQVRRRILRTFVRRGLIDRDDAREMAQWDHVGGIEVDAFVRIEGSDRAGLERLLRYCARAPFALERLRPLDAERLIYESAKPGHWARDSDTTGADRTPSRPRAANADAPSPPSSPMGPRWGRYSRTLARRPSYP